MDGVGSGRIDPRGFTQNLVGNPDINGVVHHFRPVGQPHTHRAPGVPYNWGGGDLGTEADGYNPIRPIDQTGRQVAIPKEPTFKPPYLAHFDSEDRDQQAHIPPSSFRLNFDKPLRGVFSIEVLTLNIPNTLGDVPPDGRYFWLALGLTRPNNVFQRTGCFKGDGIFHTLRNTDNTPGAAQRTFGEFALARLEYITGSPFQFFQKRELRMIKHFFPMEEKIGSIELALIDRNGVPYDMDPDESWHGSLEIVCKE